jgi:hypothetical protein
MYSGLKGGSTVDSLSYRRLRAEPKPVVRDNACNRPPFQSQQFYSATSDHVAVCFAALAGEVANIKVLEALMRFKVR